MPAILGIDAAWTEHGSSGVALIFGDAGKLQVVSAPSYRAFNDLAAGQSHSPLSSDASLDVGLLLDSAKSLCNGNIDVVAIDMPMSRVKFTSRRGADDLIAKKYGRHKASTHTPNADRPGPFGAQMTRDFGTCGFPLATESANASSPALIEIYPHVALIELMKCDERRKYKVAKTLTYWKGESVPNRILALIKEWDEILRALRKELGGFEFDLPDGFSSLASMKPYEDRLDAIISAWVGLQFLKGRTTPHGDDQAAIWVPN